MQKYANLVEFEKMLSNAYFVAKIGADTAENEQHLPKFCRKVVVRAPAGSSPGSSPNEPGLVGRQGELAEARARPAAEQAHLKHGCSNGLFLASRKPRLSCIDADLC